MKIKNHKFFWGASTAGHQVEGGNVNQWTAWESRVATRQVKTAKRRLGWLPNWNIIAAQATNPNNYISGKGVDHYNKYKEDFAIVKKLGLNSFRFSVEWSRLEPEEGKWDIKELSHYKQYIAELRAHDIEPFLTLWHWTIPVWFAEKGGFEKRRNIKYFEAFVRKVSEELLADVHYTITLNEPNVYAGLSYGDGEWPPQRHNKFQALYVYYNLMLAHKRAWNILKRAKPQLKIGVAQQLGNIQAFRPGHWLDELVVKIIRYFWNWWWLNRIRHYQDFIGFNYYFTDYYKGFQRQNPKQPVSDLGWYMNPQGILPLLQRIAYHYPKTPIIITENGLADAADSMRTWWLRETMKALEVAHTQNIPLVGYLHWSLLDNFEWAYGWWPKFGLVAVDREHDMNRTVRPSALWWARYITKHQRNVR